MIFKICKPDRKVIQGLEFYNQVNMNMLNLQVLTLCKTFPLFFKNRYTKLFAWRSLMLILYSSHNGALIQLSYHFPNWPARDVSIHQMPKAASVMGLTATGLTHCCGSINYTKPLGRKNYHYLINWWCTPSVTPTFYFWVYFFEKVPRVHEDTYPKCSQQFYF